MARAKAASRARSMWGAGGVDVKRRRGVGGSRVRRTGRRRRHLAVLGNAREKVASATADGAQAKAYAHGRRLQAQQ